MQKPEAVNMKSESAQSTIEEGPDQRRFGFGDNWAGFLPHIDEQRVNAAIQSLRSMLGVDSLAGKRVVDVGSGSGLFSLAARNLGASVHSFDFDTVSVDCTAALRSKYFPDDSQWIVEQGSILDAGYVTSLGQFDVVYAWGVLHHTGDMWSAIKNTLRLVAPSGAVFIALYNDQGWISRYWHSVKRLYGRGPMARTGVIALHWPYLVGLRSTARFLSGRPQSERGMNLWYDMKDWLGGWPFEVATPAQVRQYFEARGFELSRVSLCGKRHGCNEFVFVSRNAATDEPG